MLPAWQLPIFQPPQQVLRLVTCMCMQTTSGTGLCNCVASNTLQQHAKESELAHSHPVSLLNPVFLKVREILSQAFRMRPCQGRSCEGCKESALTWSDSAARICFVPCRCRYSVMPQRCLHLEESSVPAMPNAWLLKGCCPKFSSQIGSVF